MKEYWILPGNSTPFELKEEIKNQGGYFDPIHKVWAIKNPTDKARVVLRSSGVRLQFRRNVTLH